MPSSFTRTKVKGRLAVRRGSLGVVNESREETSSRPGILSLKRTYPGDYNWADFDEVGKDDWDKLDDVQLDSVKYSTWFRDTGTTTT